MQTTYSDCAREIARLYEALHQLERDCSVLRIDPLAGREWFELLTQKLRPQLSDDAYLVAAVVGGTNLGKSVIFNHIASCRASGTSPLASGTKHPVCLVPPRFSEDHHLSSIFTGFTLQEWTDPDAALREDETDYLFWQSSEKTAENLLVLDTPDIDSDAKVNWLRADKIRRCADVLIAVLTQQKYNDAAVKQFFRKAAHEDKAVIVVFNQCQLPDDESYWPLWMQTFCRETGVHPEYIYIAPNDRGAAESLELPFYEREWPAPTADNADDADQVHSSPPCDLSDVLSRLHFGEIKMRTLRGSLNQLTSDDEGVPAYLDEIRRRSSEYQSAAELLTSRNLTEIDNWPTLPNSLFVKEIRDWWSTQRQGWSSKVHGFYNSLGSGITWPFRAARDKFGTPRESAAAKYQHQEWEAILIAVERVLQRLQQFQELGSELLRPHLAQALSGSSRSELLATLQAEHEERDLEQELGKLVADELASFREESPQFYRVVKHLDVWAAAARPAVSIAFFVTGFGPAGDAAAQLAANTVLQSAAHVAGDVAGGTVVAAAGETALSTTASTSAGYIEAKFHRLHQAFTQQRVEWLAECLNQHLLGTLPAELQKAAAIPQSTSFQSVADSVASLSHRLQNEPEQQVLR